MGQKRAALKKLAMPAQSAKETDCLIMTLAPSLPWPAEVLVARERPVEPGETVYLIAAPYEEKGVAQHVYKGVVTRRSEDKPEFAYEFEGDVQTRGFSGAPVIDANGQVVGIHHGKYDDQPGGGKILAAANAIEAALKVVNAPAPAVAVKTAPAAEKKSEGEKPAASADESADKAAKDLSMAKNYLALQKFDLARPKLQKIAETYPDTAAGKEAKKLLKELEGK
jgi:hypothetical protein